MSKGKRIQHQIIALFLLVVYVSGSLLLFSCGAGSLAEKLPVLYGAADGGNAYDPGILAPGIMKVITSHLLSDVDVTLTAADGKTTTKTVTLVVSSYETPEKRGENGRKSALFLARDQILYGRALVAMGDRRGFLRWMRDFDAVYRAATSPFHCVMIASEEARQPEGEQETSASATSPSRVTRGDAHWPMTLAYVRALLEAWRQWGGSEIQKAIENAAEALWPIFSESGTNQPLRGGAQIPLALDVWEEPLPLPQDDVVVSGTLLSEIDLWALLALSRVDPKWAPVATHWIDVMKGARMDGELPFMAPAVDAETLDYIVLKEGQSVFLMREQLTMALRLAEVNETDDALMSMIRSMLRDTKRLPTGWNRFSGSWLSDEAMPFEYALAARLGRAAGDTSLFDDAKGAMLRRQMTTQTSVIYGALFRAGQTRYTNTVTAIDNASAVLALR